ncbi:MAG: carboxypeptidase regulatory-like domain-containing protein [Bacteroidales bacterium]|nr:carboxypeptidase regulatory-like domain-containing protein [Bacteroidales bacterium]
MKKSRIQLALGVVFAFAICMMTSCSKEKPAATGKIQGIVTNSVTGEPIKSVNISLSPTGLSAVTGSDGRYQFNNLEPGQYTVQGMKEGFESNTKNITIVAENISSGDMTMKPMVSGFTLNVQTLDFGENFSQLQFKIINASQTIPLSWEIEESLNWLTATPNSGNLQGGQETTVSVNIDRSQIQQSTTANIIVRSSDQSNVLPVNVTVAGNNGPQLQLSENSIDFGTSANSLTFYVMNTGPSNTSLNWVCSNINVDWLTLTPTSGNTAGGASTMVTATIDRTKFEGMVSTSVSVSGAGNTSTITFSTASSGTGTAILQLSEGSLDFGETATSMSFQVKNVGSAGTTLSWSINPVTVDWLTLTPMSGSTSAGSGTLVTAMIDRDKIHGPVSTTVTVNGTNNSANLNVSASYVDNSVVIGDGLFCFFTFDGDEIVDYNGNYTGINSGAEVSTDTPSGEGKSLQFNGQSSSVLVQGSIVPSGKNYTINIWFKTGKGDHALIGSDNHSGGNRCSALYITANNNVRYYPNSSAYNWQTGEVISPYLDNKWHMLTLTYNGTIGIVYVDGTVLEAHSSDRLEWGSSVTTTLFGADITNYTLGYYTGKLDNFRSYNRALTAQEIQMLYNAKQ